MAGRTEHSVEIARAPEEVFPWLFDEDKVPQWTTGMKSYERLDSGELGEGARYRQQLEVSGERITVELEVTRYEPPRRAESRFQVRGIDVVNVYELAGADGTTTLTQSVEASGGGLTGRFMIPVLQPHLERKLKADLATLAEVLQSR